MRHTLFLLKFIVISIVAAILQLLFHELGHALFALITGNKVLSIKLGVVSYADIQVVNQWSIWIISIGAFILPIIICRFLELFRWQFIRISSAVILAITTMQLGINAVAVLCEKDFMKLQTYDLGICVTSAKINNIFVAVIALICVIFLVIWIVRKLKQIVDSV